MLDFFFQIELINRNHPVSYHFDDNKNLTLSPSERPYILKGKDVIVTIKHIDQYCTFNYVVVHMRQFSTIN